MGGNLRFHRHHFACLSCGLMLLHNTYYTKASLLGQPTQNKKVLCLQHARDEYIPKCRACARPVEDTGLIGFANYHYHDSPDCFRCHGCQRPLDPDMEVHCTAVGWLPCCYECRISQFDAKCFVCGCDSDSDEAEEVIGLVPSSGEMKILASALIEDGIPRCHLECFKCFECGVSLECKRVWLNEDDSVPRLYCHEHRDLVNVQHGETQELGAENINLGFEQGVEAHDDKDDGSGEGGEVGESLTQWYYIDENGEQRGPMGGFGLCDLLEVHDIGADTLVWTLGMSKWARLGDLKF